MFSEAVRGGADRPQIHYFSRTMSLGEVDRASDGLAAALVARGFAPGDRLAVYLQNVPQFVIAMVATWKAGGIVVPINPMSKARELTYALDDSGATFLVALESLYHDVAQQVVAEHRRALGDHHQRARLFDPDAERLCWRHRSANGHDGTLDLIELVRAVRGPGAAGASRSASTTSRSSPTRRAPRVPPKGAMNTHGNVVFNAEAYRTWMSLTPDDVVLGVAPLFHITGLIAHVAVALLVPMPLVLGYRFDPDATLDLIEEHRPTFTVGAITVFIALMNDASWPGRRPVVADQGVQRRRADRAVDRRALRGAGRRLHPQHLRADRDHLAVARRADGCASAGRSNVRSPVGRRADLQHHGAGRRRRRQRGRPGEIGEIVTTGPQVVAGYWNKPEETAHALPGGALHTGDVGFMDADGWFYVVDRKKDMINASGYKVWPREVEDVLYQHPAVREAAVIGVPDEYRGETVKAFVSLRPGTSATEQELIAFCKERMAAYKYPRSIEIVDELPKTVTGKILRRNLRDSV